MLNEKMILLSPFCGETACEKSIKDLSARGKPTMAEFGVSQMGAKTLCIPLQQPKDVELPSKCINPSCNIGAKFFALFGRSY
jgi:hypothetical protein